MAKRTVDITPTWRGALPLLLIAYRDGTAKGQSMALADLQRMAALADAYNAEHPTGPQGEEPCGMKAKYVDEQFGFWFEFGATEDSIDIASSDSRMDVGPVRKDVAEVLMAEHNRVQSRLAELADAFDKAAPEAFKRFWYGA